MGKGLYDEKVHEVNAFMLKLVRDFWSAAVISSQIVWEQPEWLIPNFLAKHEECKHLPQKPATASVLCGSIKLINLLQQEAFRSN